MCWSAFVRDGIKWMNAPCILSINLLNWALTSDVCFNNTFFPIWKQVTSEEYSLLKLNGNLLHSTRFPIINKITADKLQVFILPHK